MYRRRQRRIRLAFEQMTRPIQFSVQRRSIPRPNEEVSPQYDAFLTAITEVDTPIELFDQWPYTPELVRTKRTLDDRGIEIGTVHGGHLQPLLADENGVSKLMTQVRHLHLASVIDQRPSESLTPQVSTHHPPLIRADSDADLDTTKRKFLKKFDAALKVLEPDGDRDHLDADVFSGDLITATVSIENVAPRGPHEYVLVTPTDVETLCRTAADLGVEDGLAFTCDVGHTRRPTEMLRRMDPIENVHLHSTVSKNSRTTSRIRELYDLSPGQSIGIEDRDGIAHHLPPQVGSLDLPGVLDTLDDIGYEGPLTVELHDTYRTAEIVYETVGAIEQYC